MSKHKQLANLFEVSYDLWSHAYDQTQLSSNSLSEIITWISPTLILYMVLKYTN